MVTAKEIAKKIKDQRVEYRGDLFLEISQELKKLDQGYTSHLFFKMAKEYGLSK